MFLRFFCILFVSSALVAGGLLGCSDKDKSKRHTPDTVPAEETQPDTQDQDDTASDEDGAADTAGVDIEFEANSAAVDQGFKAADFDRLKRSIIGGDDAFAVVAEFLKLGGDPNLHEPTSGYGLLHIAAYSCRTDVAQLLVEAGANLEAYTACCGGHTPLMEAVSSGCAHTSEALISAGADVQAVSTGEGVGPDAKHSRNLYDLARGAPSNPQILDLLNIHIGPAN